MNIQETKLPFGISKRLEKLILWTPGCNCVLDVGTDHGYVPIGLLLKGVAQKAIAGDVHKGPLERARQNAKKYGVEEKIEFRLGSGFDKIQPAEADVCVIAGMGGLLMKKILLDGEEVIKASKMLILQPQKNVEEIRRTLHALHFSIQDEAIVKEDGHYYYCIKAVPGEEQYENPQHYRFGKWNIIKKDPLLLAMLKEKYKKCYQILARIKDNPKQQDKVLSLQKELDFLKEVLSCLEA